MASINKVKEGQTLYKTYKEKMGRTTMSTTRVMQVSVVEVNKEEGWVSYKAPFRRPGQLSKMSENQLKSWRVSQPIMVSSFTGAERLATREEIKKMREEGKIK